MDKKKLFTHPRWHTPDFGEVVSHREISFDERIENLKRYLSLGIITQKQYNSKFKELKEEYAIKD